ncbi:MAG TPA: PQQ-dependent dehydrogenase, methanol/ethanol family [Kofleriaceae bacterium]|nr:PQQ-dependent dehydrogenase, methanol/ethanol family [Kofleriaceae bacterium]
MKNDLALCFLLGALGTLVACQTDEDRSTGKGVSSNQLPAGTKLAPASTADDGQWVMSSKDYANTRFSTLDQITAANVKSIKEVFMVPTGDDNGHEAAPLVVGDTMYIITPFPNRLIAVDAKTGEKKWTYEPKPDPAAQGVACCDQVSRGGMYHDGKIYYATLDAHLVAVDATTGREVWNTKLGDINIGETITMSPIVVKGKVLVGNSGGEMGVRGWLTAVDAATGEIAWRAYSTGPDKDVLIGANFKPFYEQDRGTDLGVTTWPPGRWQQGGGTVWGWLSYDPALDLVYYGTSNPGPWNADMRPGDNKWTAGIFARRPDTGEAIWFYQYSPHDLWDHDGINESILLDATIGGTTRHVLLHPERNGYIYMLDRATGEVLSADPYVHITTSRGVDLKTGKLDEIHEKEPHPGRVMRDICPFAAGAKDWQPSAFSPQTGLLYIPHQNMCMDEEYSDAGYIAGTPYVGAAVRYYAAPGSTRGRFTAWDPIARKAAWIIPEDLPVWSGTLVTAGGVVFYGTMDGWFKAVDAKTGLLLWSTQLPSGIIGQPVTYRASDGKQYVAVLAGVGGWPGMLVSLGLDVRDQSAANGWGNALQDLPARTRKGGSLHVFALP